ncbi:hypothetical protein [Cryobacterium melibiosiphilum]|nr:hypothetical protein [Cryobacterium melibiosiphilum]
MLSAFSTIWCRKNRCSGLNSVEWYGAARTAPSVTDAAASVTEAGCA